MSLHKSVGVGMVRKAREGKGKGALAEEGVSLCPSILMLWSSSCYTYLM